MSTFGIANIAIVIQVLCQIYIKNIFSNTYYLNVNTLNYC